MSRFTEVSDNKQLSQLNSYVKYDILRESASLLKRQRKKNFRLQELGCTVIVGNLQGIQTYLKQSQY